MCGQILYVDILRRGERGRRRQETARAGLGLKTYDVRDLKEVAPYRYRFTDAQGIVENEICPVLVGYCDTDPKPDQREVEGWRWIRWEEFLKEIKINPGVYSPWCREEAALITPLV